MILQALFLLAYDSSLEISILPPGTPPRLNLSSPNKFCQSEASFAKAGQQTEREEGGSERGHWRVVSVARRLFAVKV